MNVKKPKSVKEWVWGNSVGGTTSNYELRRRAKFV
jgi:hypothetical protein